jgi:hypothetical protein
VARRLDLRKDFLDLAIRVDDLSIDIAEQAECALGVSFEMPTTKTPFFSNFLKVSRNSQASTVQPGVLALG